MNNDVIIETVNKLFVSADNSDWSEIKRIFNDTVLLDYTSMAGGEPVNLTAVQIIDSWKGLLPGFDKTHHQLGNYLIKKDSDLAKVFCYGTATHYLVNESKNNVWTVVGSYDFELKNINDSWRITEMKFNFKYIDGNNDLPRLAQERLKK
ncbi:MAG TPA: nuclear transport factor 2 family protein [Cyclobacteriaceae bacterium]